MCLFVCVCVCVRARVCVRACVREMRWCSTRNVAFHSFAWPRGTKEANSIARTLFINHCGWVDVLVVRGRCFSSSHACFGAGKVLDELLWGWSKMWRPYVVYNDNRVHIGGGDPVPVWLSEWCVYKDLCQCDLVGFGGDQREVDFQQRRNLHHPGAFCNNLMWRCHKCFKCRCRYSRFKLVHFDDQCDRNAMDVLIAAKFVRSIVHVLVGDPPSIHPRVVPLMCVFRSRERKPNK